MYESRPVQDCDIMKIKSRRRNPVLADIFSRLKYMERRGSGFKKIRNEYAHHVNYRETVKPEFYSDNNDFILTLYNLNYCAIDYANYMFEVSQMSPNVPKLKYNLLAFLKIVQKFPGGTLSLYATEMGMNPRTIKRYLYELKEKGVVRRIGTTRKGYWEIINEVHESETPSRSL